MTDRQRQRLVRERLAARMHQREARLLRRLIRLGRKLTRQYAEAARRIAAAAAGEGFAGLGTLEDRIAAELRDVASWLRRELGDVARDSHRATAAAIQASVPRWWLVAYARRRVLPVREKRDEETEAEMQLLLDLDRVAELSPEEAKALVQSLLFEMPSTERVEKILNAPGPGGVPWDERLKHWEGKTRGAMRTELTAGLAAGENVDKLRKRLRPLADGLGYKAQRIARTEGARVAHRMTQETYAAMGDAVEAQTIVAVMDEHTRTAHAMRNGRTYRRREDGTYRADNGDVLPDLPDQPNCRCYAIPDLGMPEYLRREPAARASYERAAAKLVPDPAGYADWWQQASAGERKAAVGARRYHAARDKLGREPRWADFLGPDGKLLSAQDIRGETSGDRKQRLVRTTAAIKQRRDAFEQAAQDNGGAQRPTPTPQPSPDPAPLGQSPPERTLSARELERTVRSSEVAIRTASTENLVVIGPDGREVLRKTGTQTGVSITYRDTQAMRDAVVTHNHPKVVTPSGYVINNVPVSGADVRTMITSHARQMRAVTESYRFSISLRSKPATDGEAQRLGNKVRAAWQRKLRAIERRENQKLAHEVAQGRLSQADMLRIMLESQGAQQHEAWLAVAPKYGLRYRRQRHGS